VTNQTLTQVGVRQWTLDPSHSEIGFSVRHMMISKVRGNFASFSGTAEFDPEAIEQGSIAV
jgi:polyisoprenoid-binding protein YceI